ncbi:cytochrome P450 [Aspergillus homomorphus CBS 101889]|uniref:Cytochrome P450 n=1 Tax=Aspergillus homomorphus (strain CBS 101889) TaxID=1450537 RepID=A0A395HUE0_ASPHC|nr:cytochrome P450 [Aspergillus homomorphus CBS 101889]RAL11437.1 cytochrome P450 [Aspergillus homomorphus CBS 101889]
MLLSIIITALLAWLWYSIYCLIQNINRARKLGLPYHILPVSPVNPLWVVLEPVIFYVLDRLPFQFGRLTHYGRRGWQFKDKAQSHLRMGDAFAIATPFEVFVYICDAQAITEIINRRSDFVRPVELYKMLDVFGPNVATTIGADWQRHRKIVAAPFNERLNSFVWDEAISQTQGLLASRGKDSQFRGLGTDIRILALNVLAATGFKRAQSFQSSSSGDHRRSYGESLNILMENSFLIMVIPPWILRLPILPSWCRRVGHAFEDFRQHMLAMFNEEKALIDRGQPGTGTLMSTLIRESEVTTTGHSSSGARKQPPLTLHEILGNIYVINFAGHDTTANTLTYLMFLLAAYPDIQEWIAEEIRTVIPAIRDTDQTPGLGSYKEAFPRLKRCFAVLLETVRLYPAIIALPKSVAPQEGTTLHLLESNRTLTLPQGTAILPSLLAVQTHPRYWPEEPQHWRPRRWIQATTTTAKAADTQQETIMDPKPGTYIPWSAGVQVCAGQKFAQVETVALLAACFRAHRLRAIRLPGKDFEAMQKRLVAMTMDTHQLLVIQMRDPDSVPFVWEYVGDGSEGQ